MARVPITEHVMATTAKLWSVLALLPLAAKLAMLWFAARLAFARSTCMRCTIMRPGRSSGTDTHAREGKAERSLE